MSTGPPSREAPTQQEGSRPRPGSAGNPATKRRKSGRQKAPCYLFHKLRRERGRERKTQNAQNQQQIEDTTPLIPGQPRMPRRDTLQLLT
ncbi:hypothetical protein BO71DRAFT_117326 [Aspergillus ellipticus CBS 707.79]|uniref:Uncharacterized protein n=1 Tax=Aspergillus ellipticus CBS 707.79 TaxID=1448320 RepID=A0A319DM07_9EURO|nr:hypothetical protein BO71DRAFT_117326 [Aspergillus ellipticus CBS 707.79]